jgi:hypothetical protein
VGFRGRAAVSAAVATSHGVTATLDAARAWVRERLPWQARHLERAYDWTLELEPHAPEALMLAAMTHDMERGYPEGSPLWFEGCWADTLYRMAHSERSARIVGDFVRDQGLTESLVREVVRLIVAHEVGGWREADLLQAADSLSFLETIQPVISKRLAGGTLSAEGARAWLDFQFERMRLERAREIGRPMLARARAELERELSSAVNR